MDTELDLTPEVNSNNLNSILDIMLEFPPTADKDLLEVETILATKTAHELLALKQSLQFFFSKGSLTLSLFEFLLETSNIESIAAFLPWLDKIIVHKAELLEISNKLTEVSDVKKVIDRLNQLKIEKIISATPNYDFFYSLVLLIENELDTINYVQFLARSEQPHILVRAYLFLKEKDLLTAPYDEFISQITEPRTSPLVKVLLLTNLKEKNLLNDKNFKICKEHNDLPVLENITTLLAEKPTYLEKYFLRVAHKNASAIQMYLHYLKNNNLLDEAYLKLLDSLNGNKLENFIRILILSDKYLSEHPESLISLSRMKNRRLKKLIDALRLLKHENYLNQETTALVFSNSFVPDVVSQFVQALIVLKDNKFASEWVEIIHASPQPLLLTFCITELYKAGILSRAAITQINQAKSIDFFYRLLKTLSRLKMLTETNFENLSKLDNLLDFESYRKLSAIKNISEQFFIEIFNGLLNLDLPQEDKIKKISALLADVSYIKRASFSINPAESTHIVSIQKSFIQVIKKFVTNYSQSIEKVKLDENFKTLVMELESDFLPDDPIKYLAAKRALGGIISDPAFIDSGSGLNLRELVVLLWMGIQDNNQRKGSLVEAKKQFLEGLYEIQRGGNINAQGQDNGLPDEPICCTGAVHKLLEKLVGVHDYLEFIYITPELASIKFPIIVKEEAINYLLAIDPDIVCLNYDRFVENGVSAIWKYIKSNVQERMLEEFGALYVDSDKGASAIHESFEALLESHIYLNLDANLLSSIKASQALKNFESAIVTDKACSGSAHPSLRQKRVANFCFEQTEAVEKRYRPLVIKNEKLKKVLAFFVGIFEGEKRDTLLRKLQSFEETGNLEKTAQIEQVWNLAQARLMPMLLSDDVALVELDNQKGKKNYLNIQYEVRDEGFLFSLYSPEINKGRFFYFNPEYDLEDCIELYSQLLFPEEVSLQIKQRYFTYCLPKEKTLRQLGPHLKDELAWFSPYHDSVYSPLMSESLLPFFLIEGKAVTAIDQLNLRNLENTEKPLSFILNKIVEVFSLSTEQQVHLGALLNTYFIDMDESYFSDASNFHSDSLQVFRKDLLKNLMDFSKANLPVDELSLTQLAKSYLSDELTKHGAEQQEVDLLLDNAIQSHNNARSGLASLIPARQTIVFMPALLQAVNGHTENLQLLTALIASDVTFNQAYQALIKHPNFFTRFPKTVASLTQLGHVVASPVAKFLVLNSFFELSHTLSVTTIESPEHQQAKSLLMDNSLIFGSMFAEAIGLELGPGGLILDLGITIHQLMSSAAYLRQHYHLRISLWEGIKFNLGFSSLVIDILEKRELLRFSLQLINQLSENYGINFKYVVLKLPILLKKKPLPLEPSEFPEDLLVQVNTKPWRSISTIKYEYTVTKLYGGYSMLRVTFFSKKQYTLQAAAKYFLVNFTQANRQVQEANVFVQSEKKCINFLINTYGCIIFQQFIPACYIRQACEKKSILVEGWQTVTSMKLDANVEQGRLQENSSVTIEHELGGMLQNKRLLGNEDKTIDLLILFHPRYGNMELIDGSFLQGKSVYIFIQDSVLFDAFSSESNSHFSIFLFYSQGFAKEIHYQLGKITYPSHIFDFSEKLLINVLPLSDEQLPDTVFMKNQSTLIFGEKGPQFFEIDSKKEISINFNQVYLLREPFNFTANILCLENAIAYPGEYITFNLQSEQHVHLNQIAGRFQFLIENIAFDLSIKVKKIAYQVVIKKQEDFFYLASNLTLNEVSFLPYYVGSSSHFFFIAQWRGVNDRFLISIDGSLGSTHLQLILEGDYIINDKYYRAQFTIQDRKQVGIFFKLAVKEFLVWNLAGLKQLLGSGFTSFLFFQAHDIEQVDYTADYYISYKNISYNLGLTH